MVLCFVCLCFSLEGKKGWTKVAGNLVELLFFHNQSTKLEFFHMLSHFFTFSAEGDGERRAKSVVGSLQIYLIIFSLTCGGRETE